MTLKYLITGATGCIGSRVLAYFVGNVPSSDYAATSSREASRQHFEKDGIAFRLANYDEPETLDIAFKDVENLFFVSTDTFDTSRRIVQHRNAIEVARRAGVKHIWYTSLAFGGLGSDSKISVQSAHLQTEKMLKDSDITYTSIREGLYAEIFPIFLQWYPHTETVYVPNGQITLTSMDELAEATAKLLIQGGHENEIVLLCADEPLGPAEIVRIINETTNRDVKVVIFSSEDYATDYSTYHQKEIKSQPEEFWHQIQNWCEGIAKGDLNLSNPLMREVLGREPLTTSQSIRKILKRNPNYTYPEVENQLPSRSIRREITEQHFNYEAYWCHL